MKRYREDEHGRGQHGWLQSLFHFSFAEYFNPDRMGFGVLRVLNDDVIAPESGFPMHPHENMEIFTYIIEGELTHQDSMGSKEILKPGDVQYMSAGTGVYHSEYNEGAKPLRLLQIWILPDRKGHTPDYGSLRMPPDNRRGKWLHMVSSRTGEGLIKINQDANIHAAHIEEGKELAFTVRGGRQVYGVLIEGKAETDGMSLSGGDGFESDGSLRFIAHENSHVLLIEMEKRDE